MKSSPDASRRAGHAAFTLIELLAALAVASVLILLISFGVGSARKQMQNATCVQRLRALGGALFAFAGDHQGRLLPRSHGLYREEGEENIPEIDRPWVNRLIRENYASPDILYCPAFTPFRNDNAATPLPVKGKYQTYGLRVWTLPGTVGFWPDKTREELKPLSAIENPADFFIVADSIWTHPAYLSQGYGLTPGLDSEQFVHLRHAGRANALFADGHVEAKPASYFAELHKPDRQAAYSGGQQLKFGITDRMDWPAGRK